MKIKRGDIFLANLDPSIGSEQGGIRPVLIIQNNRGNKYSPTTIVACITSQAFSKASLPTHYLLPDKIGLRERSIVMFEQIRTIDKSRLTKRIAHIPQMSISGIDRRLKTSLFIDMGKKKKRGDASAKEIK